LESVRFEKFTLLIDGIHKSIGKIKFDTAPYLGIKSVHVFWIYELSLHPDGLTAAEIAAVSMVDRSLVSREIAALKKDGYVASEDTGKKRNYNARITLTEKGMTETYPDATYSSILEMAEEQELEIETSK